MRTILSVVILLTHSFLLRAQITFTNSGFEGTLNSESPPPAWISCDYYTSFTQPLPMYKSAYQGNTYLGMESGNVNDTIHESAAQKLPCNLVKGKMHHFNLHTYRTNFYGWEYGNLEFWAGSKLCAKEKLLWYGTVADTVWTELTASFVPDQNYDYILFTSSACDTCFQTTVGLDDLSEITVENYNLLSVSFSDTVVKKDSCVNLTAESDDTTGHFNWSSIPSGFNASGSLASVCPDQNTKYICTITSGCGIQKTDTINVEVVPNGVENIKGGGYLSIYPNPAQNELTIDVSNNTTPHQITIIDALGRVELSLTPHKPTTQLNISALAAGIYFIKTRLSNGNVQVNKFVKQ